MYFDDFDGFDNLSAGEHAFLNMAMEEEESDETDDVFAEEKGDLDFWDDDF